MGESIRAIFQRLEARRTAQHPVPESAKRYVSPKIRARDATATRPKPAACEICGSRKLLAFDHCHASGKFRGWLCGRCNMTLGAVNDDPDLLGRLAEYLRGPAG